MKRQEIRGQPVRVKKIKRTTNHGTGKSKDFNKIKRATDQGAGNHAESRPVMGQATRERQPIRGQEITGATGNRPWGRKLYGKLSGG